MYKIIAPLLQAVEPNNDDIWTDNEILWVLGVVVLILLVVAAFGYFSGRDRLQLCLIHQIKACPNLFLKQNGRNGEKYGTASIPEQSPNAGRLPGRGAQLNAGKRSKHTLIQGGLYA